jgi:hypothetical protein
MCNVLVMLRRLHYDLIVNIMYLRLSSYFLPGSLISIRNLHWYLAFADLLRDTTDQSSFARNYSFGWGLHRTDGLNA